MAIILVADDRPTNRKVLAATPVIFYYHEYEARRLTDTLEIAQVLSKPAPVALFLRAVDSAPGSPPAQPPALPPDSRSADAHLWLALFYECRFPAANDRVAAR